MNEQNMRRFFDEHRDEYQEDIMRLVRIPSVSSLAAETEYPFGKACADALDTALDLG